MFIDLFKEAVDKASAEELRKLVQGIIMDLEATDNEGAQASDIRGELLNTFMVYLLD